MELLQLSVGMIQRAVDDSIQMLLKYDACGGFWRFVVGQRLENESFRDTILREVAWQLDLDFTHDFLVAHMALLTMESIEEYSGEDSVHLRIAFYPVHLYRKQAIELISRQTAFRWFTCREICNGRSDQGDLIDPHIVRYLRKWEVVQPWN